MANIISDIFKKFDIDPDMTIGELIEKYPNKVEVDTKPTSIQYKIRIMTDKGVMSININNLKPIK